MLNEFEEFRAYTEPPIYKAGSKRDTIYMGRFTMEMILDFTGLARVPGDICLQMRTRIPEMKSTMLAGRSAPGVVFRTKRKPALKRTGSSKVISGSCMVSFLSWWTKMAWVGFAAMFAVSHAL